MLTQAQLTTLKADLAANANTVPINGVPTAITAVPRGAQNAQTVADWYNQTAAPTFWGNYSAVPAAEIFNAISWKKLTPADPVPATPDLAVQVWKARATACQGYQFNLEILLLGRSMIDATKGKIRTAFQDALSAVPSDAGGALQDAGWAAAQKVLCRPGTNGERLFADTSGGTGGTNTTAATFTVEGFLVGADVLNAWAS